MARRRRSIGCRIEMAPHRRLIDSSACHVGSNCSRDASSWNGNRIDRRLRESAGYRHLNESRPFLEERSLPPAHQCSSTNSHARGVLELQVEEMTLIEGGASTFSGEIAPVLSHGRCAWVLCRCTWSEGVGRCRLRRECRALPT